MPQRNTLDKIVKYFAALTEEPFTYKKETYEPKPLIVSPLLIRGGFKCVANCGGCCPRFSLDYLPGEPAPSTAKETTVEFNGKQIPLVRDMQTDHKEFHCRFLSSNGLCQVYPQRPFSCDFEPIRVLQHDDHFELTQKPFGRGWAMTRVDGQRGALCIWEDPNKVPTNEKEVIQKLLRLKDWMDHFGLTKNRITRVIEIIPFLKNHGSVRLGEYRRSGWKTFW